MSSTAQDLPINQLAQMLASDAESVASMLLPHGKKNGDYWTAGDLYGGEGKSLRVKLTGSKAGVWNDYNKNPGNLDGYDLVELWSLVNCNGNKAEAIKEITKYLGVNRNNVLRMRPPAAPRTQKKPQKEKLANPEFLAGQKKRLRENPVALEYLKGRGLSQNTVERFGLGLTKPHKNREYIDALAGPVTDRAFRFRGKYAYYDVPGVTHEPVDRAWMAGNPMPYYADAVGSQKYIFVCEGLKDVWRLWQSLDDAGLTKDYLVVSSTHGSSIPDEWKDDKYWQKWDEIYFGHDNDDAGELMAEKLWQLTGRDVKRVRVPKDYGKDWTDFLQNGGTIKEYESLLESAEPVSLIVRHNQNEKKYGRIGCDPIDINGAWHNGHLYYPARTLMVDRVVRDDGNIEENERYETVVVRSDQTLHKAEVKKAPPGTPIHDRVIRLTDGTLIDREPMPNDYGTWSWPAIEDYLEGKTKTRSLGEIVHDVLYYLNKSVWLPYDEDYAVLALAVPATYVQSIFESVPLLMLNGAAGSGKTQMGTAMSRLCANGNVIGQVSAAAAARHIDACRGFVVMDDLEAIGSKNTRDNQFNELVQALKQSYNKHSAVKLWTDVKTMKTERLNFFGIKLINNTLGADQILGSRMIRIQTRKMPDGIDTTYGLDAKDLMAMRALRDELHVWAFENAVKVARTYEKDYGNKSSRAEEIAAPLRIMAHLVNDEALSAKLEAALARQHVKTIETETPEETLKEAIRNLVAEGFIEVTVTHIGLEMKSLLDENYGRSHTHEIAEWERPEWIGRMLRSHNLVNEGPRGRKRFFGKNLTTVDVADWFVEEVRNAYAEQGVTIQTGSKSPDAFCQGCDGCQYRNNGCTLMELRKKAAPSEQHPQSMQ